MQLILLLFLFSVSVFGQFSTTARHIVYGSSLPATCNALTGDVFVKNNVNPTLGYLCTATNTWTLFAGTGGSCGSLAGNVTGTCAATVVQGVRTGTIAALPATCAVGDIYFATNATAGQNIYECAATNTWTQQVAGASPAGSTGSRQSKLTTSTFTGNGGSVDATAYGCLADGTTDNATCVTNALAAISTAGGGELVFPAGTSPYKVGCFTIPNDGNNPPAQNPLRITSATATSGFVSPATGARLDLRCNTTGRIVTLGNGNLEIDHITLMNGNTAGGDTVPFIFSTNTTLNLHDLTIIGDTSLSGANNIQDAIQLGNGSTPSNTTSSSFSGYGTVIDKVFVDHVKRFLYFHSGPAWTVNGIQVTNNTVWQACGSNDATNGAAIDIGSLGTDSGNYFAGNLLEGVYKWMVRVQSGNFNVFIANNIFDDTITAAFRFESLAGKNLVIQPSVQSNATLVSNQLDNMLFSENLLQSGPNTRLAVGESANTVLFGNVGAGYPAIWPSSLTPSSANYGLAMGSGGDSYLNGGTEVYLLTGGTIKGHLTSTLMDFTAVKTSALSFGTATNCADSAGAAACGSAAAGRFVADAAATSVVVSTTAVTANSEIFVEYDSSLGTALSVTCNATIPSTYAVTARTAGTSFTLTTTANVANPGCFSYHIVN